MSSLKTTASWVIVELNTNKAILETFSEKTKNQFEDTKQYKAIPILEYLQSLNNQ